MRYEELLSHLTDEGKRLVEKAVAQRSVINAFEVDSLDLFQSEKKRLFNLIAAYGTISKQQ